MNQFLQFISCIFSRFKIQPFLSHYKYFIYELRRLCKIKNNLFQQISLTVDPIIEQNVRPVKGS